MNSLQYKTYGYEMEKSIVGAILLDDKFIDRNYDKLDASDIQNKVCRTIWESAGEHRSFGKHYDAIEALKAITGMTEDPNSFLADCMEHCPSVTAAEGYIPELHKAAKAEALRQTIYNIVDNLDDEQAATEIIGACTNYLQGYTPSVRSISQIVMNVTKELECTEENKLNTGYDRLDHLLKGFRPGELILLAARPSVGKSIFVQSIVEHVALNRKNVLVFSLEMTGEELVERWLARVGGASMDSISDHNLNDDEWRSVTKAAEFIYRLPVEVCDNSNLTVEKVKALIRQRKKVDLVIVDFISLLTTSKKTDNRNLEVGLISRQLKMLAMELKIPIIALSQLSRAVSDTEEPNLSCLRDSGELEQNANKVIFLWNVDKENGIKGVSVAKNRRGKTGSVQMKFDGDRMWFDELMQEQEIDTRRRSKMKRDSDLDL